MDMTAAQIIEYGINYLTFTSEKLAETARADDLHYGHYFWIVPASIGLNLINITLAPVIVLANLIAAAIFGLINCCTSQHEESAKHFLLMSVWTITDELCAFASRLFVPSTRPPACISSMLSEWLELDTDY